MTKTDPTAKESNPEIRGAKRAHGNPMPNANTNGSQGANIAHVIRMPLTSYSLDI